MKEYKIRDLDSELWQTREVKKIFGYKKVWLKEVEKK